MTTPGRSAGTPRLAGWAVLALTLLAALWRFPFLTAQDLWFDEVFSVVLASQAPGELVRRALADQTNPPGFYFLLWGWMHLGGVGESWLRALPAIAGTLTVPAIIALGRTLGMRWSAALVGGLLAVVSPLLVTMSLEVRAYAPLALVATCSLLLATRLQRSADGGRRREAAGLAVADAALVTLHYFGALLVLARISATFITSRGESVEDRRRERRAAITTALPAAALLVAWLALVLTTSDGRPVGGNADWIPMPGATELLGFGSLAVGTFGTAVGAWAVSVMLIAATLAGLFAALFAPARRAYAPWLVVPTLLPILLVLIAGACSGRSLWVGRYLVVAFPALLLLLADLPTWLMSIVPPPWRAAPLALVTGWAVGAGAVASREMPDKPDWSRIVPALAAGGAVTICVNEAFVGLPLQYYAIRAAAPLAVAEVRTCAAERLEGWVMLRPGTEGSLAELRAQGARLGVPRPLGTGLPPVTVQRLEWPAP